MTRAQGMRRGDLDIPGSRDRWSASRRRSDQGYKGGCAWPTGPDSCGRSFEQMAVTYALVLALAASACAWHPTLPAERRAQYYLLHDDGAYQHGFDTGAGQWATADGDAHNQVSGEWKFVDDAGQAVHWAYTSGVQGYVPVLAGSPHPGQPSAPPAAPPAVKTSYLPPLPPAPVRPRPDVKQSGGSHEGTTSGDASYAFEYQASDHSRQESSDASGNVQGNFRFKADDGVERRVDYIAGADTGFVAKGDHLPVAPEVPEVPQVHQKQVPQVQQHVPETKSWGGQTKQSSWSNSGTKNVQASSSDSVINPDGSFQFSYVTDDHSRQESSDASGNVQGNFRFTADDGVERRVDYIAGANTGFVAKGDHLPVAPEVPEVPQVHQKQVPQVQQHVPETKSWGGQTKQSSWSNSGTIGHVPVVSTHLQPPASTASSRGDVHGDDGDDGGSKAYSYSYDAVLSSKQESADEGGNVVGSFEFVDGAGEKRKLSYTVKGEEGFVAVGDHLPKPVEVVAGGQSQHGVQQEVGGWSQQGVQQKVGGWSQQEQAGGWSQQEETGGWNQGRQDDVQQQEAGGWSQQEENHQEDKQQDEQQAAQEQALLQTQKEEEERRTAQALEQVEEQLRKDQQRLDEDAILRQEETQRLAEELERIQQTEQQDQQRWQQEQTQQAREDHQQQERVPPAAPAPAPAGHDVGPDGSYSFAYSTDTQSVSQSGDGARNAARGSFSFVAPDDAQRRTVDWTADARTGFVATGAHLPVAPALPIAPVALPASKHSSTTSSHSSGSANAWASKSSSHGVKTTPNGAKTASHDDGNDNGDGSYSYSYHTDNAQKQEVADKAGNVKGSFSYRGGDGVERKVEYTANDQEGFVAKGDHLPSSVSTASSSAVKGSTGTSGGHVSTWTSSAKGSTGTSGGHVASTGTSSSHGSRPYAPLPVVRTPIKTQTVTSKGHGVWGQGKTSTKTFPEVEVTRYLPPDSPKKWGYVFDTVKA